MPSRPRATRVVVGARILDRSFPRKRESRATCTDLVALVPAFAGTSGVFASHSVHSRASGNTALRALTLLPWVPAFAGTSGVFASHSVHSRASGNPELRALTLMPWVPAFAGDERRIGHGIAPHPLIPAQAGIQSCGR